MDEVSLYFLLITIIGSFLVAVSSLTVAIRVYTRVRMFVYSVIHESIIVVVSVMGVVATALAGTLGHGAASYWDENVLSRDLHKFSAVFHAFYKLTITLATISLLLQYRQYFGTDRVRMWTCWFLVVTLVSFGAGLLVLCLECSPILSSVVAWTDTCGTMPAYWIFDGILSLALSSVIAIFPIPLMRHSRAWVTWFPTGFRVVLAMGIGVTVASLCRLLALVIGYPPDEPLVMIKSLTVNNLCCLLHSNLLIMLACTPTLYVHRRAFRDMNGFSRDAWPWSWIRRQPPAVVEEDIELQVLPTPTTDNQALNNNPTPPPATDNAVANIPTTPPAPTRRPPTPPLFTRRSSTRPVSSSKKRKRSHSKLRFPRRLRRTASKRIGLKRKRLSVIPESPEDVDDECSSPKARQPSPVQEQIPASRRYTIAGYPERSNADVAYYAKGCRVVRVYRAGTPPPRRPPVPFQAEP